MRTLELSIRGLTEERLRRKRDGRRGPALVTALLLASLVVLTQETSPPPPPRVLVSPTPLEFGDQIVGTVGVTRSFWITNTGVGSFETEISLSSPGPADFEYEPECGVLEPGQSCEVVVTYSPALVGKQAARISVKAGNSDVLAHVELTGAGTAKPDDPGDSVQEPPPPTAEAGDTTPPRRDDRPPPPPPPPARPELVAERATVEFKPHPVGSTSDPEHVQLRNPGTASFSAGYAVGGDGAEHFQVGGCDGGRRSFFFGKDCTLEVRFRPQAGGPHDAVINIRQTTEGGQPVNDTTLAAIELHGTGLNVGVEVTPQQLDFREPAASRQDVTFRNSGEVPVKVYGTQISGPDRLQFRADANQCTTQPVGGGGQCVITVTHRISGRPQHNAAMVIEHSAGRSADISLYWEPPPVPTLVADPQSIDFGTVDVDAENAQNLQSVTVTNTGIGTATNIGAYFVGGNNGSFRVVENGCQGATIQTQGRCTITVAFVPNKAGSLFSTLVIATANANASVTVSVNGQGRQIIIGRQRPADANEIELSSNSGRGS